MYVAPVSLIAKHTACHHITSVALRYLLGVPGELDAVAVQALAHV